jgi:hypothetical protein
MNPMESLRKTDAIQIIKVMICLFTTLCLTGCGKKADSPVQKSLSLTGDWSVRYKFDGQMLNASMHLEQKGHDVTGAGKDDPSGTPFTIDQGLVRGHQLTFVKKYGGDLAKLPPIQYAGTITAEGPDGAPGPYISGDYSATSADGKAVSNDWDAVKDMSAPPPVAAMPVKQAPPPPPPPPPRPSRDPNKPPDLSGKWEVGFEYQFRTVQSQMFLEQDWEGIHGHGMDDNHEKFIIQNASYKFPSVTIVRKYPRTTAQPPPDAKGKNPKGKDKPTEQCAKTMVVNGDVSWVDDSDYQGPYMAGKTDGGGKWEAQLVK